MFLEDMQGAPALVAVCLLTQGFSTPVGIRGTWVAGMNAELKALPKILLCWPKAGRVN